MVSKRQLGYVMVAFSLLVVAATLVMDWLGMGSFSGIGPFQRLAFIGAGITFLVGLTLLPLGDRPA